MTRPLVALVSGLLFGAGLAVSGMVDPTRVRGFLDLFGRWDPTLAFVMAGALLPMVLAWAIQQRMARPIAAPSFDLPSTRPVDGRLVAGAALFGVGWGLAGLCPGPALAGLALEPSLAGPAVAAMCSGMALHALVHGPRARRVATRP
ncbi:MAG: YeeE/YedE family protein [Sphingomonadaceae bacterium]|uniref:DUF6691 family protein n=1 Tax=Thermaurantiacus sp. TaxID=2820283 RepID=UPI00298EE676|nr:DUF6691 family protein [Thermaurantiacus sp.]MCS6986149.1 YeeE/YedE family protein [Sphingomonadaceae bacterium]MDW8414625.1 YeeE/YedE family protein [Thermaurantiacus sp.]